MTASAAAPPRQHNNSSNLLASLLSGLSSGVISTLLLQPFDVAKTSIINPSYGGVGMLQLFRTIAREEGALRLWRGLEAALLRITVGSGCYFLTQTALLSSIRGNRERQQLSSAELMTVGAASRGVAVIVCCPISVVKTRVEGSGSRVYSSALQGLTAILRTEGVRGLYAGLLPSLLKDCPFSAVYLVLYTQCKTAMAGRAAEWQLAARGREKAEAARLQGLTSAFHVQGQTPVIQFSSALLAASAATTLFQPLEVIKTRLQLQQTAAAGQLPASSFHRFRLLLPAIYAETGARGFFAGLLPRVIRRSLSNAIAWSLFEQIFQFWSGKVAV